MNWASTSSASIQRSAEGSGRADNIDKYTKTVACNCVDSFCETNKLNWLNHDTSEVNYSYHADVNRHYSLIDHFICSPSLVDGADPKVCILVDGDNTSDHYAISLGINVADNNENMKNSLLNSYLSTGCVGIELT